MDENINVVNENEDVATNDEANDTQDNELKEKLSDAVEKLRTQAMLLGAQVICSVILQKIEAFQKQPGKRTMNDYKRLTKDIEQYCRTGVSRKVNDDGTTSEREESEGVVQD